MHEIKNLRQALRFLAIAKEKIKTLKASEEELKEQVAQLGIEFTVYKRATDLAYKGSELETQEQLIALQSKSDALVDALETYFKQYPHMMKGYILDALAAYQGASNVKP